MADFFEGEIVGADITDFLGGSLRVWILKWGGLECSNDMGESYNKT